MSISEGGKVGVIDLRQVAHMTGREILEAMIEGSLPRPTMSHALDFALTEVGDGFAVFEGDPNDGMLGPFGSLHGGWVLTLIDSATACAAQTTLPPGEMQTTVETKANMTRPLFPNSGRIRCEGRVVAKGQRIITTEAKVTDKAGRVVAHGTSTLMVLKTPGG